MAEPLMTVEVDIAEVLSALEKYPDVALPLIRGQAHVTAQRIARAARARVRRRTGLTAYGIQVREDTSGKGWMVVADREPYPILPYWLEFGTIHMQAYPFLFNSARLEEADHLRRVAQALQDASETQGFGGG